MLNKITYFFYYLKKTDYKVLKRFLKYAKHGSHKSYLRIIPDTVLCSFKYNISLLDYFNFRFFEKGKAEREKWAGTGFMYEYQLRMNPLSARDVLCDKAKFLNSYGNFVNRKYLDTKNSPVSQEIISALLSNPTGKLVLKNSLGQVGAEVEIISCHDYTADSLLAYMLNKKYDLIEEYVVQHPLMMELSPSGLNTIRIITQLNHDNEMDFLGARLRISVNSHVDNLAAGNLAAPIDIESGTLNGPGIYSDITKAKEEIHPVTGINIRGFKIPYWNEALKMAREAALLHPENKSIGWDIAISDNGPELIEGNHNWCKLLWQLPVNKGLKQVLKSYLPE